MKTLRNPVSCVSSLFVVAVAVCLAHVPDARAGTVRGTVKMPDASRSTRLYHGYWRLENGNVPVQTAGGAKAETVVVLENVKGAHAPSARTVTIELGGLDARPRLVDHRPRLGHRAEEHRQGAARAVDAGQAVGDAAGDADARADPPPALRRPRRLRHPRQRVPAHHDLVLVVGTTYFSAVDDKGSFSIANVPDGNATLKVWARGKWVAEQQTGHRHPRQGRADDQGRLPARPREGRARGQGGRVARGNPNVPVQDLRSSCSRSRRRSPSTFALIAPRPFERKLRRPGGPAPRSRAVRRRADVQGRRPQVDRPRRQAGARRHHRRVAGRGLTRLGRDTRSSTARSRTASGR